MRERVKKIFFATFLISVMLLLPAAGIAGDYIDDFHDYGTPDGKEVTITLPKVEGGWFTPVDFFPEGTTATITLGGTNSTPYNVELRGRGLAVNNKTVYLQKNYGSSVWVPVATTNTVMDPAFVHISPSGSKIAIGKGWGQEILIFSSDILSESNPPLLDTDPRVTVININHYDAAWLDDRYLLVNGGSWPGPPYGSGISWIDTEADPVTGGSLITDIPGASAGIAIDKDGNLITGIGYAENRTGELKLWTAEDIMAAITSGTSYEYDGSEGKLLAQAVLSGATLGIDNEGNLHVGGGKYVEQDPSELGFAAIIHHDVLTRVASHDGSAQWAVDENNPDEYKELAPDECRDDTATFVTTNHWGRAIAVIWNPDEIAQGGGQHCTGAIGQDMWGVGVVPMLTYYYPRTAKDEDNDGVPDASDNAWLTPNPGQEDTDGDGWANIVDADLNNDDIVNTADFSLFLNDFGLSGTGMDADFNSDGYVNLNDYSVFKGLFGSTSPWY